MHNQHRLIQRYTLYHIYISKSIDNAYFVIKFLIRKQPKKPGDHLTSRLLPIILLHKISNYLPNPLFEKQGH